MLEHGHSIDGRTLGKAPLSKVLAMFWTTRLPQKERGGNVRDDSPHNAINHHVESTFNPEQYDFVVVTLGYLNALAKGKVMKPHKEQFPMLCQRIRTCFLDQTSTPSFGKAVTDGVLDLISDFQRVYPNLVPALHAAFMVAGTLGVIQADIRAREYLMHAIDGTLTHKNKKLFQKVEHTEFIDKHPRQASTSERQPLSRWEVWCLGEAFAQTVLMQSKEAALEISQLPALRNFYQIENGHCVGEDLYWPEDDFLRINGRIGELTLDTISLFFKGEVAEKLIEPGLRGRS